MHLFLPFYVSLAMWTIGTATADLNAYANYTSPFVGDKARRGAYFRDDQYLVNLNDGNRRLRRIQLWCGPAVWQMIPWYERHDGSDSQHWQYGSNDRQGTYKEMVLGKNEWITQVRVDKCPLGNKDWRICYIEILKNRQGSQISSQSDWLSCGQIQYGNNGVTHTSTGGSARDVTERVLLSFGATTLHDGLIGMETRWINVANY